jgi:nucleoside-diphosphate-sugar epimerase
VSGNVLVVGCGYVGLPLARSFVQGGWSVIGLTGSIGSAEKLASEPFAVFPVDISSPNSFEVLPERTFDLVVHCASSGRRGPAGYRAVFVDGVRNLRQSLRLGHLVLTSSTSVYGQTDGAWLDESSPAEPPTETSQILRESEDLGVEHGGTVGRLAGIYGPDRCVPLRKLLAGAAVLEGEGERVMNQIHRDDAVSALRFLAERCQNGVFNVADNEPVTQREWYSWVCAELGRPLPPFGPRDLNRKRGWTNKRVSNRKLRSLGWGPRYPSFREGIAAIISERNPGSTKGGHRYE